MNGESDALCTEEVLEKAPIVLEKGGDDVLEVLVVEVGFVVETEEVRNWEDACRDPEGVVLPATEVAEVVEDVEDVVGTFCTVAAGVTPRWVGTGVSSPESKQLASLPAPI